MTHKQRVRAVICGDLPDRVPLDATFDTSSSDSSGVYHIDSLNAQEKMMNHLKTDVFEVVLERLGVDVRRIEPKWLPEDSLKKTQRPHAFKNGIIQTLETSEQLDSLYWPQWTEIWDPDWVGKEIKRVHTLSREYAIYCELASIEGYEMAWGLRGQVQFSIDLKLNPAFAKRLVERVVDIYMQRAIDLLSKYHEDIDIVEGGGDLGTQNGLFMSPATFRELILPGYKRGYKKLKKYNVYHCFHSCGSVEEIINDYD